MEKILFLTVEEFDYQFLVQEKSFFSDALFGFPVEKITKIIKEIIENDDGLGSSEIVALEEKFSIFKQAMIEKKTTDFLKESWWFVVTRKLKIFEYKNSMAAVALLLKFHSFDAWQSIEKSFVRWDFLSSSQLSIFFTQCEKSRLFVHPSRFKLTKKMINKKILKKFL